MINLRKTAIAMAVAALVTSPLAFAQSVDDPNLSADILHNHVVVEDWDITVDDTRNTTVNNDTTNSTTDNATVNNDTTNTVANTLSNDTTNTQSDSYSSDVSINDDRSYSSSVTNDSSNTASDSYSSDTSITDDRSYTWSNDVSENIERTEVVNSDIRKEGNEHQVAVSLKKDLSLNSDIDITGAPTVSGEIAIDSAAIAVVDNRQSSSSNVGSNDMLTNSASIADDVGSEASGNLAFNVAGGDNNVQDNAAALSAADASFAFGMADAEVFVNQTGNANVTTNQGVTNAAGLGGNAFNAASGNIGVNITSGNNNQQKNALAASVATSAYAQSSVSSNQNSSGNLTTNAGHYEQVNESMDVAMSGSASGSGTYSGTGASYQMSNLYPESWGADSNDGNHISTPRLGHIDLDSDIQGAVVNPYQGLDEEGVQIGGIAFDSDESGIVEFGEGALDIMLSGSITNSYMIAVDATNTAALSGSAFSAASGNVGINVSAGTGNMQANSLSMAVAQPSTGGTTPPPTDGGGGGG